MNTSDIIESRADSAPVIAMVARAFRTFSPRLTRRRLVAEALAAAGWRPIFWPDVQEPTIAESKTSRPIRREARVLAEKYLLLDRFELASAFGRHQLKRLAIDAGYLAVPTFSTPIAAAKSLRSMGKPYVVDTGDPWALHGPVFDERRLVRIRARRLERQLYEGAAGVVVTTPSQAATLSAMFPGKPILTRVGGFQGVPDPPLIPSGPRGNGPVLRLAHFGRFDRPVRLDPLPFLESLAAAGIWDEVVLTQFGPDPRMLPEPSRPDVTIEHRDLVPWPEAVRQAERFDAALVIGNSPAHRMQLPSKAIEYLSLPIPRIALSSGQDDALYRYALDGPGYLVVLDGDMAAGRLVADHLRRDWDPREMEAPPGESWGAVAEEVARFVGRCIRDAGGKSVEQEGVSA